MSDATSGGGGASAPPPSVHELLVAMRHGDLDAADALDVHYRGKFYAHAMARLRSHERALAVVDRLFLKVFEKVQTYDEHRGGGAGWMYRILAREILDTYRKDKRDADIQDEISAADMGRRVRGEEIDPQHVVLERERVRCLLDAFARLSPPYRAVIRRYWYIPAVAATEEYGELRPLPKGKGTYLADYQSALLAWHRQYRLLWEGHAPGDAYPGTEDDPSSPSEECGT